VPDKPLWRGGRGERVADGQDATQHRR
jgi:hypothetical protein